jgi:hypothetical protein
MESHSLTDGPIKDASAGWFAQDQRDLLKPDFHHSFTCSIANSTSAEPDTTVSITSRYAFTLLVSKADQGDPQGASFTVAAYHL